MARGSLLAGGVSAQQVPGIYGQALYTRRGDRLGTQQYAGERVKVRERNCAAVERGYGCLGLGDLRGDLAIERQPLTGERVGKLGVVVAAALVRAGLAAAVRRPVQPFVASHAM